MTVKPPGRPLPARPTYPAAARQPVVEVRHGVEVADPYRWLEDPASPVTRRWLAAQRALTDAHASDPATREALLRRLHAFAGVGTVSPPVWRGDREFVVRRKPGQELPALHLIEPDGQQRPLLDPLVLDPTGLTTLDRWQVSWDGRFLAYQVSHRGTEHSRLYVREVDSGEVLEGPIDRLRHAPVVWAPDSSGFWYVRRLVQPHDRITVVPRRLFWHWLGRDPGEDEPVFGDGLPVETGLWPRLAHHRWLTMRTTLGTSTQNALWVADLHGCEPAGPVFHPVLPDPVAAAAPAVGLDGRMYLRTTLDAPRGRICAVGLADLDRLGPGHWRELVAEQPDSVLRAVVPLAGGRWGEERLLVLRTRQAASEAAIHDPVTGDQLRELRLPGAGTLSAPTLPPEGGRSLWFRYTDHATPATVMRYDLDTHRVSVHARPPGRPPTLPVTCREVAYRSIDGARVRMFLIAPESCAAGPDRTRPTLLTGYGGFGVSMVPRYSGDALPWVEAGGVVAVACLRGGGEEGEQWHRAATGPRKQSAIDDFNAAAGWLVDHGWATTDQLAAAGSSNGGLLVTAAMVQRPELYRAVAAVAPLTDMIRYEQTGLGPLWRSEYGTTEDAAQFEGLLGYSPYHRVRRGVAYPAVLLMTPENDTRVDPLHSRKLCAALQHATSGAGPILLRTLPEAGHGPGAHHRAVWAAAETLAFLAEQTGLAVIPGSASCSQPSPDRGSSANLTSA